MADSTLGYDRGVRRASLRFGGRSFGSDAAKRRTFMHQQPKPDGTWTEVVEVPGTAVLAAKALPNIKIKIADLD